MLASNKICYDSRMRGCCYCRRSSMQRRVAPRCSQFECCCSQRGFSIFGNTKDRKWRHCKRGREWRGCGGYQWRGSWLAVQSMWRCSYCGLWCYLRWWTKRLLDIWLKQIAAVSLKFAFFWAHELWSSYFFDKLDLPLQLAQGSVQPEQRISSRSSSFVHVARWTDYELG